MAGQWGGSLRQTAGERCLLPAGCPWRPSSRQVPQAHTAIRHNPVLKYPTVVLRELSVMMEMLFICIVHMVAVSHAWLLSTYAATEELNFLFCLILITSHLHLNRIGGKWLLY